MGSRVVVETGHDRKELIADAGFGRLSFASVAAGVLTAYGAFAVLAGFAAGILAAADVDIDVAGSWRELGIGGGLVVAGLLLVAYLFGGYVAGRMARRAGALHGAVVFVLGLVVVAAAALITSAVGGADAAATNLRELGVPTTASEWGDVASTAGLASLVAMLAGALAGGALGERWHTKLLSRALDPDVGAEAEARETAARLAAEAEERRTESVERVRTTAPTATVPPDADLGANGSDDDPDAVRRAYAVHPATQSLRRTGAGRAAPATDGDDRNDVRDRDGDGDDSFWWRLDPDPVSSGRRSATDRS